MRGEIEQLKIGIHGDIQIIALSAEDKCARVGVMGGAGTGTGKVDIKDVAVRDLSEKADAADLRKWQRTVELQLEACYDMTNFDLIVERSDMRGRRSPQTRGKASWTRFMSTNHTPSIRPTGISMRRVVGCITT